MSREQSRQDKTQLKEEVEELRGLLDARDGEIKVYHLSYLHLFPDSLWHGSLCHDHVCYDHP